jgi:3-oxoadipate enol-lactonase
MPPENRASTLARVDEFERNGVRVAFEATANNGYPEELRGDRYRFEAWRSRWLANDPASFAAVYRMLSNTDLTPELPSIKCPVLVIGGEFDRGRPPSRVEPIAKAIPGAKFKVLRTGHYAGWQTPELVATEIGVFLDSAGA